MLSNPLDFEEAVVGGLLIAPETYSVLSKLDLRPEHFHHSKLACIYKAVVEMIVKNINIDTLMASDYLRQKNQLEQIGGEAYLFELANNTPSSANIMSYAEKIIESYRERQVLIMLEQVVDGIKQGNSSAINDIKLHLPRIELLCQPINKEEKIRVVDVHEFLVMHIKPRELIMAPWLPQQGLAMIYASPGVGKTHLSLNIAYAIASGSNFLSWSVSKPRKVLFIDGEMSAADIQNRLAAIAASYDAEIPTGNFKLLTPDLQPSSLIDLATREGQFSLEPYLDDIEVIIVDNISCLCRTGRENEAESWNVVQDWALHMRASGRTVIFIHHASKSGDQRGTSKRTDVLDTCIKLERTADHKASDGAAFELHFEKNRGFSGSSADSMMIQLQLNDDGTQLWEYQALENSTFDKVVKLYKEGVIVQKDIAEELSISKSVVSRHLKRAREEGYFNATS